MFKKIERQECLVKFSSFPLREYDKMKDDEVVYFPYIKYFYWINIEAKNKIQLKKKIALETVNLYRELGINRLTFLCDGNTSWITKNSKDRTDYKQLTKAIKYLRDNKIDSKFSGGIIVDIENLKEFIEHFYVLTMCDASFSYYHFIDDNEDFIGYIHYDGDVLIYTLSELANERFLNAIKKTNFKDTGRIDSDRI